MFNTQYTLISVREAMCGPHPQAKVCESISKLVSYLPHGVQFQRADADVPDLRLRCSEQEEPVRVGGERNLSARTHTHTPGLSLISLFSTERREMNHRGRGL